MVIVSKQHFYDFDAGMMSFFNDIVIANITRIRI